MKIGNRIIYNQDGEIIYQTGEMEINGDGIKIQSWEQIHFLEFQFGEIDLLNYRIVGIDVNTKKPILEQIIREKTDKEIIEDLENQLLLLENERLGGGIL